MINQIKKTKDKNMFRLGLAFFLLFVVDYALQYGVQFLLEKLNPELLFHPLYVWVMSTVPLYLAALPVCLAVLGKSTGEEQKKRNLGFKNFIFAIIALFGVTSVGNFIGNILISAVSFISKREIADPLAEIVTDSNPFMYFLVVVIIAPIGEEFLFRRLVIDRTRKYGELFAVMLSAFMFSAFHTNVYQLLYAFLAGALFGYIYVKTSRLRYTIILHSALNLCSGFLPSLILRGLLSMPSEFSMLTETQMILYALLALIELLYLAFLIVCTVTTVVLAIVYFRKIKFEKGESTGNLLSSPFLIVFFALCLIFTVVRIIIG